MALLREDFLDDAAQLGCEIEAIMAVAAVESRGGGFNPDKTLKTLFEGHIFSRLTKGKYDKTHPTISYPKWVRTHYGKTWQAEQARLNLARSLDDSAALQSASWGMFQIMGMNHKVCGYNTVQEFVQAISKDENMQLQAFTQFVIGNGLATALQRHDWVKFTTRYNGPGQVAMYSAKLAAAYAKLKKSS